MEEVKYNPDDERDRLLLANSIKFMLLKSGFAKVTLKSTEEDVYERELPNRSRVRVYTTIQNGINRGVSRDSIKVCGVYLNHDGFYRFIGPSKRIHRVGSISGINTRLIEAMRDCWRNLNKAQICNRCGAPKFLSKKNNLVCSELCFKEKQ